METVQLRSGQALEIAEILKGFGNEGIRVPAAAFHGPVPNDETVTLTISIRIFDGRRPAVAAARSAGSGARRHRLWDGFDVLLGGLIHVAEIAVEDASFGSGIAGGRVFTDSAGGRPG